MKCSIVLTVLMVGFSCTLNTLKSQSPELYKKIEQKYLDSNLQLNNKLDTLIKIALDKNENNELRHLAIHEIGEINTNYSLEFLVENIELRISKDVIWGDIEMIMETPCFYELYIERKRNWNLIPIIFKEIKKSKTDNAIEFYSLVLEKNFGKKIVIAIAEFYKLEAKGFYKENIYKIIILLNNS